MHIMEMSSTYQSAGRTFKRLTSRGSLNYMRNDFFMAIKVLGSQIYLDVWCTTPGCDLSQSWCIHDTERSEM